MNSEFVYEVDRVIEEVYFSGGVLDLSSKFSCVENPDTGCNNAVVNKSICGGEICF